MHGMFRKLRHLLDVVYVDNIERSTSSAIYAAFHEEAVRTLQSAKIGLRTKLSLSAGGGSQIAELAIWNPLSSATKIKVLTS
jgi:hypothetical protein